MLASLCVLKQDDESTSILSRYLMTNCYTVSNRIVELRLQEQFFVNMRTSNIVTKRVAWMHLDSNRTDKKYILLVFAY